MLKQNVSLKLVSKIAATVAIMMVASACTHEQLKQEADVSAIEGTALPTPDLETPAADPLSASTPIPGDLGVAAPVRHAKKSVVKHARKHLKAHRSAAHLGKKKKAKTMIATRGTVESQLPPAPPSGPEAAVIPTEAVIPAPAAIDAASTLAAPADLGATNEGGHGLMISLAILGLGALAFAGVRLRRSRGSRRLVFN